MPDQVSLNPAPEAGVFVTPRSEGNECECADTGRCQACLNALCDKADALYDRFQEGTL